MAKIRKSNKGRRKTRRRRDYKKEYAARINKGLGKGLNRSQARGHASAKKWTGLEDRKLQNLLRALRRGHSLAASSRIAKLAPERARRMLTASGAATKRGRRFIVRDDLPRRMMLYSNGQAMAVTVSNRRAASEIAFFMNAVRQFLRTGDADHLKPFPGQSVTDMAGAHHSFETDPNTLYRLDSTGTDPFELVYRIVV